MKLKHHIYFWVGAHVLLTFFFKQDFNSWMVSFCFVSFLLPPALLFSYLFNQILIPKYLLVKQYALFVLYFIYSLITCLYIQSWVLLGTFLVLDKYEIEGLASLTSSARMMALTMMVLVLVQSLIILIIDYLAAKKNVEHLKDALESQTPEILQVRSNRKIVNVNIEEICFVESLGDYIFIHLLENDKVRVKEPISKFYKYLPEHFIRIHRSFVVNKKMVTEFSKSELKLQEHRLPISRSYKKEVYKNL